MMEQRVVFSQNLQEELAKAVAECEHDRTFVLADETTAQLCWPVVSAFWCLRGAHLIIIKAGDTNKDLAAVQQVWTALQQGGATRHSLLINIGGGMVTDLGGFAASTFKRGINFINIPTTLLSMVDASVGGKTGINFGGLKNEIGVFNDARYVILDMVFLQTLDEENILSGYAEMLKHSLLGDTVMWANHINTDLSLLTSHLSPLHSLLKESVLLKQRIVTEDPHERGLRKALNLGHTFGHAFESFAMKQEKPILHGYAVAYGLVCELYLSSALCSFPTDKLRQTVRFIREHYGQMAITCDDYPALLSLMRHDKKNTAGHINFTLLGDAGDIRINQHATDELILEALDFYREG